MYQGLFSPVKDKIVAYQKGSVTQVKKILVIGAGPAGMMAAITAKKNNKDAKVQILEHGTEAGKKILVTGNGRCNFTNAVMSAGQYPKECQGFVHPVLNQFSSENLKAFFMQIGLPYKERNGYFYPRSDSALAVRDALAAEVKRLGIWILDGFETESITCTATNVASGERFVVRGTQNAEAKTLYCDVCILACGSSAAPKTGSDGSGFKLARGLGLKVKKPVPALTPLELDSAYKKIYETWAGVRSNGRVAVIVDNEELYADSGELQFTNYGISGIPVFQISRYASRALDKHRDVRIRLNLLEEADDAWLQQFMSFAERRGGCTIPEFCAGLLNQKLTKALCRFLSVPIDRPIRKLPAETLEDFLKALKNLEFIVTGSKGAEQCQVMSGGIKHNEINAQTMEAKSIKGLFVCGELVDVDGPCGGYNLQWAFSSGFVAGRSAAGVKE